MSKGQLVTGLRRVLHAFKTQQKLTFSRRKIQTYEFELPMAPELREDGFLEDVIQVERYIISTSIFIAAFPSPSPRFPPLLEWKIHFN